MSDRSTIHVRSWLRDNCKFDEHDASLPRGDTYGVLQTQGRDEICD